MEGVISVIGFVAGVEAGKQSNTLDALTYACIVRGGIIGSRLQFQGMNKAIGANSIKPVVDRTFGFEQAKEAYQYVWNQKHVGKVIVRVQ